MNRQAVYASIAETIEDCQAILAYINRYNLTDIRIITLSLEAYRYLLREPRVQNLHIWKLLDMETLLHQAFLDAQQAAAEWVKLFSEDKHNLHDQAVQAELDRYVFYHLVVCIRVAEALKPLFLQERWTYLVPPIHLVWLSRYFPNFQRCQTENLAFKAVSADIFSLAGIHVRHISVMNRLKLAALPLDILRSFLKRLSKDLAEVLQSWIHQVPTMENRLTDAKSVDAVLSGWGRDISRMLSYSKLKHEAEQDGEVHILNTVWRPAKVEGFDAETHHDSNSRSVRVDEEIKDGVAYGPRLWMFGWKYAPTYFRELYGDIYCQRLQKLLDSQGQGGEQLGQLLGYRAVRCAVAYLFLAYRQSYLHTELCQRVIQCLSPSKYVGSDSADPGSRSELLMAEQLGVRTFSVPHGYTVWVYPSYFYVADRILVHGGAQASLMAKQIIGLEGVLEYGPYETRSDK